MNAIKKWMHNVKFLDPHIQFTSAQKLFYPAPFYLLRGESQKFDFPITSRWSRKNISDEQEEMNYYERCFKEIYRATPFKSDLNLRFLAFLQHHDFKTRLIDTTSKLDTALYFALKDDPTETGYIYKMFGYDILALANNLDQGDIGSILFDPNFPPSDHPITRQHPRPYLFYRDTNYYNINAVRQDGWFIIETKQYKAHQYTKTVYPVTPDDKAEILQDFKKTKIDDTFYFPDLKQIAKTVK
jgi:hypothetical protein